jgi:hypothetical protein
MFFNKLVFNSKVNDVEVWINYEDNHELDVVYAGACSALVNVPLLSTDGCTERAIVVLGINAVSTLDTEQVNFMIFHEVSHILLGHITHGHKSNPWKDELLADALAVKLGASPEGGIQFLEEYYEKFKATNGLLMRGLVYVATSQRLKQLRSLRKICSTTD